MNITETTVRPVEGGYGVLMALGNPDGPAPHFQFLVRVECLPEGRPPLQELQKAALSRAQDALREQISRL